MYCSVSSSVTCALNSSMDLPVQVGGWVGDGGWVRGCGWIRGWVRGYERTSYLRGWECLG